jgi:inorganic triphosphatase YgiF
LGNELVAPIFAAGDEKAKEYWMEAERFNRQLIGHILPCDYYAERNAIEDELIRLSREADAKAMHELSLLAVEKERTFVEKWSKEKLQPGKVSATFRKNWEKKNSVLK